MSRTGPTTDMRETRDPNLIREDIARTRWELGQTMEALSARADVKTRAREAARETVGQARDQAVRLARPAATGAVVGTALAAGALVLFLMLRRRRRGRW